MHGAAHLTQYIGVLGTLLQLQAFFIECLQQFCCRLKKSSRSSEARSSGKKPTRHLNALVGSAVVLVDHAVIDQRGKEALGVSNEQISFWFKQR